MVGAVIVGGIFEGILGLTAKYWCRIISPIVSSCLVFVVALILDICLPKDPEHYDSV